MNLFNSSELEAGRSRYGARENATGEQVRAIEAILSNDEASSGAELVQHFVSEIGVTEAEARRWVSKRDSYLRMENAKAQCARCGQDLGPGGALGIEHGGETYCPDCAVKKGFMRPDEIPNAEPGYDQPVSTTTFKRKKPVQTKYYTVGRNSLTNMACPVCGKDQAGVRALMDHLQGEHDMTEEQAEKVLGARDNAAGVYCDVCGLRFDTEKELSIHMEKYAGKDHGAIAPKNTAGPFVPMKNRLKVGQARYGKSSIVNQEFMPYMHCVKCDQKTVYHAWTDDHGLEHYKCSACKKEYTLMGRDKRDNASPSSKGKKQWGIDLDDDYDYCYASDEDEAREIFTKRHGTAKAGGAKVFPAAGFHE